MNVLVTGGAGYIGSHVCKALSQKRLLANCLRQSFAREPMGGEMGTVGGG